MTDALLQARHLVKNFPVRSSSLRRTAEVVQAVSDVSFDLVRGETLGLVGESGCGKSTTGRLLLRLIEPTGGQVLLDGIDVLQQSRSDLRKLRRRMQMVFQDPYASLDPRMNVEAIIGEPLRVHGAWSDGGRQKVADLMRRVGMKPEHAAATPMSSPAASASASASPARSSSSRSCSCSTSRCRRSTCRSRPVW